MADAPLVAISGLGRRFTSRAGLFAAPRVQHAVADVTLDLARGEVVGVVGESGCGKSTLARLVLRLIEPTSGSVSFDGTDIGRLDGRRLRALRRRMQMVFQDPYSAIDPRLTIGDAVLEPFRIQRIRQTSAQAAATVERLLSLVGLPPGMARNHPHQLSGGQKQRAGIARALALNPDFLVLDEPTASLDMSIQAQIITVLEDLRRDLKLTYLFISHDLGLVRYFCDRVVVMYLGRIVEILPTARLGGEMPSAFNLPPGCAFAQRCARASDDCRTIRPDLAAPDGRHLVACHHPLPPGDRP